jgi:hypothetical protein
VHPGSPPSDPCRTGSTQRACAHSYFLNRHSRHQARGQLVKRETTRKEQDESTEAPLAG